MGHSMANQTQFKPDYDFDKNDESILNLQIFTEWNLLNQFECKLI